MTSHPATGIGAYAELDGTPDAAGRARELVRQVLGSHHPSLNDAALIASELAGNAVAHSRSGQPGGAFLLAIEATADTGDVHIQVRDAGGSGTPAIVAADQASEHGRGLAIIAALASQWGSEPTPVGRTTWARISHAQRTADEADVPEREAC